MKGGLSVWRAVLTPYRRHRQFVPDDLKDDKYWARRRKNNMAAKRSRDARRMKENQIAMRAGYLEKEVSTAQKYCDSIQLVTPVYIHDQNAGRTRTIPNY